MECIFCKIIDGDIPSNFIYEDEKIIVIDDINPVAPVHLLVIPKKHIANFDSLSDEDMDTVSHIMIKIRDIARDKGISEDGYRIVNNCKGYGGQVVDHIHFHLIGGRQLGSSLG